MFERWNTLSKDYHETLLSLLGLCCLIVALPFMQTGMFGLLNAYSLLLGTTSNFSVSLSPLKPWVSIALVVVTLALVAVTRCYSALLAPVAIATLHLAGGQALTRYSVASFLYLVLAFLILASVAWRGPISKNPLLIAVIFVFIYSILPFFDIYMPIYAVLFIGYNVHSVNVLTAMSVWLLARLVLKALRENRAIFFDENTKVARQKRRVLRAVCVKTGKLWWPMAVMFFVFTGLNIYIQGWVVAPAIIEQIDIDRLEIGKNDAERDLLGLFGVPEKERSRSIEDALTRSVQPRVDDFVKRFASVANDTNARADLTADQIVPFARHRLPQRFPGTEQRRCGINVGCLIANGVKSMLNSGYISARESMLQEVGGKVADAKGNAGVARQNAVAVINAQAKSVADEAVRRIQQTASGLSLVGWLLQIYAVLVLIKSFLIVAARVYYQDKGFHTQTPTEQWRGGSLGGVTVAEEGSLHLAPATGPTRSYFMFKAIGPNAVDRRRVPHPFSSVWARIVSGKYLMCLIDLSDRQQQAGCDIKVDAPGQIVVWEIKRGAEVFVRMSDVIGFSDECSLGRRVSLNVATLVFGRIFFQYVRGPKETSKSESAFVYLRSSSSAIAGSGPETTQVMHSTSLSAWGSNVEFNIASSLTMIDVFFSGFSIRKVDEESYLVSYDTSQTKRLGTSRGIWRTVRTFILPI